MARPITVTDPRHRIEQATYRRGLDARRSPEAPQTDTAITVALYGLLREIAIRSPKRSRKSRDEFLSRAADVLVAQGFDRARSIAVLRRRLVRPPERFDRLLGIEDLDGRSDILP
ncbi:hypothetical protein GGQ99_005108 [Aminobacter niigataensis]|uniref:Uncharacterized protein n=1 Tax=Aminobacter niigataensis TaxID=83265 RepID=A0ABR6L955_9HYPH|nr:hypothetical protein [Aminobacter niigataensis]